jgi:peptidoglycan/LPS O-acetylase OafA/YrhL
VCALFAGAAYFGSPAIGGAFLVAAVFGIAIPVAAVAHFAIERPARKLVACFSRIGCRIEYPHGPDGHNADAVRRGDSAPIVCEIGIFMLIK